MLLGEKMPGNWEKVNNHEIIEISDFPSIIGGLL